MIDIWKDGTIKLIGIDPDKVKEKIKEIEQNHANAVIMLHQMSKKYIIVDKRFQKRLESEELGSWKKIK